MKNRKGQALVEYILIIVLISVFLVSIVSFFGGRLKDYLTKKTCEMLGDTYVAGEKSGDGECVAN